MLTVLVPPNWIVCHAEAALAATFIPRVFKTVTRGSVLGIEIPQKLRSRFFRTFFDCRRGRKGCSSSVL